MPVTEIATTDWACPCDILAQSFPGNGTWFWPTYQSMCICSERLCAGPGRWNGPGPRWGAWIGGLYMKLHGNLRRAKFGLFRRAIHLLLLSLMISNFFGGVIQSLKSEMPLASAKPATTKRVWTLLSHAPDAAGSY